MAAEAPPAAPIPPEPVLLLAGFGLAYDDRMVLRAIDLAIPASGCTVLLGPSGTGKSSLLRTLAGYNDHNRSLRAWGQARYQGQVCAPGNRPALVVQKVQLMMATVLDNLAGGLPDRARLTRAQQLQRLKQVAAELQQPWILENLHTQVLDLTVARQRAIAILREFLGRPALLMLDEPTTGLPDEEADALAEFIALIAQRQAVLLVLHHLRLARRLAQHAVLIASGETQESAPAAQFFGEPCSAAARQFIRTGSCPEFPRERGEAPPPQASTAQPAPLPSPPLPPTFAQPVPWASASQGPRGFAWLLPGQLAGTPWPGVIRDTDEDLDALRRVGVTRLVSLTEVPFPTASAMRFGMQCASLPVPDMQAPSLAGAAALCRDIDRWLTAGDVVALHCKAGLGRTGTLLAAYWLWQGQGQRSAAHGIERIRRLDAAMIQSPAQTAFLAEFANFLFLRPQIPPPGLGQRSTPTLMTPL